MGSKFDVVQKEKVERAHTRAKIESGEGVGGVGWGDLDLFALGDYVSKRVDAAFHRLSSQEVRVQGFIMSGACL